MKNVKESVLISVHQTVFYTSKITSNYFNLTSVKNSLVYAYKNRFFYICMAQFLFKHALRSLGRIRVYILLIKNVVYAN